MKKVLLLLTVVFTACSHSPYGRGGENACQFVKEQVPGLRDDIASVEVVRMDSLLTDEYLDSGDLNLHKGEVDYYEGRITREELDSIISDVSRKLNDVEYSWKSQAVNDSLRKLNKYSHWWRKVYTVRVTMKSGVKKEPRIMMNNDGVTPHCIEKDVEQNIKNHVNTLMDVVKNIMYI